ncbi:MAG: diadenylate cyclase CdaA [Bacilli bacterium]|nr:diadenylate cyclase CdaA [Bacilli bacterium]
MTLDGIVILLKKLLDVLLVWMALYFILKNLRQNMKMVLLFKGILIIVVLKIFSDLLDLTTISYLLDYVITWGPLALIVIFQPEIRNVLEHLGRSQLLGKHKMLTVDEREKMVYEMVNALDYMSKARIGSLTVFERDNGLTEYIEKSKKIYADISSDLLISIFFPNNPLHDGGVIVQGNKVTSAGAVFPTSDNLKISKRLGTRHRAALGISEASDCISVISSEETGRLSVAMGGKLHYNLSLDEVKLLLLEELRPKKSILLEEEEMKDEEEK